MPSPARRRCALPAVVAAALVAACASGPRVLGATESIHVVEAGLDFRAVIDTGAYRSSIHALGVEIEDRAPRMRDDVGKRVSFRVANEAGEARRIASIVTDVEPVRTSLGAEWRYVVPLRLRWSEVEKVVHVSLRDRSAMTHKLLIGRDWLRGDFVVDVGRGAVD